MKGQFSIGDGIYRTTRPAHTDKDRFVVFDDEFNGHWSDAHSGMIHVSECRRGPVPQDPFTNGTPSFINES